MHTIFPVSHEHVTRPGRSGPPLAQCSAVCVSASQLDFPNSGQSAGAGIVANFGGSSVTIQTLDSGDNLASSRRVMATPHLQ